MPKKTPQKQAPKTSQADANLINAAAEVGDLVKLDELLARRVDINARDDGEGLRPLINAAKFGQVSALKFLLERGAKLNATATYEYATNYEGLTALIVASKLGHLECVRVLVEAGADLDFDKNADGRNAITLAAEKGHIEVVRCLLSAGAVVPEVALRMASAWHHPEMVRYLLENGATSHLRDDKQGKLLRSVFSGPIGDAALQQPQLEVLNVFLAKGADVNASDDTGWTPLMAAISKCNPKAAIRLMEAGADVTAKAKSGLAAIHLAAGNGLLQVAEELIRRGADPRVRTWEGISPLDQANHWERREMVRYLEQCLATLPKLAEETAALAPEPPTALIPPHLVEEEGKVADGLGARDLLAFISDWGHPEWVVLAVEVPLEKVSATCSVALKGNRTYRDVATKSATMKDDEMSSDIALVQFKTSAWTVILRSLCLPVDDDDFGEGEQLARDLSAQLQTRALVFLGEDTADAMGYVLYQSGVKIGERNWGSQSESADEAFAQLGIYLPGCYPRRAGEKVWLAATKASLPHIQRADIVEVNSTRQP